MTDAALLPGGTFRVGVTGARTIPDLQRARLGTQVAALLDHIVGLARGAGASRLQLLSPLAEGADRLVTACAMNPAAKLGFELICPMPFPRGEYEKDFAHTDGSLAEFKAILEMANPRVLELDGRRVSEVVHPDGAPLSEEEQARADRGEKARAYEAVGRLIVRNCDLIVAIWDGLPGQGRGGTADTIRYAASFGPPVVWLHSAADIEARWIEEAHDLLPEAAPRWAERPDHPPGKAEDDPALTPLRTYITRLLAHPPHHPHAREHGWLYEIGHAIRQAADWVLKLMTDVPDRAPLLVFLREKPHCVWGPWHLNTWFIKLLTYKRGSTPTREAQTTNPVMFRHGLAEHWRRHRVSASERASECSERYRSSYVAVFLLATIALIASAIAPEVEAKAVLVTAIAVELGALLMLGGLVVADGFTRWQARAIDYRLLGELCRKQQALAPLGWVVPRASAWATTGPHPPQEHDAPRIEPISWVAWLFSAWLRDTPMVDGRFNADSVAAAKTAALRDLLDDQIGYHTGRRMRMHRAGERLIFSGEILFGLLVSLVLIRLLLVYFGAEPLEHLAHKTVAMLGVVGLAVSAGSAALVGIRAYVEMEMLAEQSQIMLTALRHARKEIEDLDPCIPLASQALGSALAGVATLMLEDLEGWARLFRAKVVEA